MFTKTIFDETVKGVVTESEFVSLYETLRGDKPYARLLDFHLEQSELYNSVITVLEAVDGVGVTSYILTTFSVDEEIIIVRTGASFRTRKYERTVKHKLVEDYVQVFVEESKAIEAFRSPVVSGSRL